jgi:hypothetical protein
MRSPF